MTTITNIEKLRSQTWKYTYTGTSPYRIYHLGKLLETTTDTEYEFEYSGATIEAPALEILDANDTEDAVSVQHPPRLVIQWYGNASVYAYKIQEYSDSVWRTRAVIYENGSGYYTCETSVLDDVTSHLWRVVATDDGQNESAALSFSALLVRVPDSPELDYSYDADTGKLETTP
jgi:hypothetical protein